ncbi:MAG TPA: NAD(P)H-binding protein [Solirubrobacteraceae bacterium]
MKRVLIAGASGFLGRHIVLEASSRGYSVRALIRDPDKRELIESAEETIAIDLLDGGARLHDALAGVDVVVSAAGQPCTLQRIADRRSFRRVDHPINRALLDAAIPRGVRKFVYVTVLAGPELRELDYVAAHEEFVTDLKASAIDHTVVRANGFFYSYLDLLDFARRGLAVSFADGSARSNPIHEADLAVACVEAIESESREIDVGGPEIVTRREEMELAFAAVSRNPRVLRIPGPLFKAVLPLIRLGDRRRGEMLDFLAAISGVDVLAPQHGSRRLGDYLREHA